MKDPIAEELTTGITMTSRIKQVGQPENIALRPTCRQEGGDYVLSCLTASIPGVSRPGYQRADHSCVNGSANQRINQRKAEDRVVIVGEVIVLQFQDTGVASVKSPLRKG